MQIARLDGRLGAGPAGDLAILADLVVAAPRCGVVHGRVGGVVSVEPGAALQRQLTVAWVPGRIVERLQPLGHRRDVEDALVVIAGWIVMCEAGADHWLDEIDDGLLTGGDVVGAPQQAPSARDGSYVPAEIQRQALVEVRASPQGAPGRSSAFQKGRELQDGVPVPKRGPRPELLLDKGGRQARAADAVGVHDVGLPAAPAHDLPSLDGPSCRPLEWMSRLLRGLSPGTVHRECATGSYHSP